MEEHNYKIEDINSNNVEEMKEVLNNGGTVTVTDSEGETYTVESAEANPETENAAESVERARQELMELISDPRIIQAYRKARARGNGDRQHVSKTEKKKKKAKRRMSNKSKKH